MQNGYVDNAWVNEQSGITATNGGSIKVANNTDIKGAIIASDNKDKAIEIDTKTFTYENIKDKQEGKTTGFGISGGTTGGVPATSVQYASNDKRQDTNATLSNVNLTVNGEKVDSNTIGINTDITQAQVITKDERVDMIDVNLQTDLTNKEERDKIRDAKDKVEDVAKTVENVIDKGNVGGIKENYVNNRFATRGANAVEDDPKLSKALENFETLSPEQKYTVMLKLADTMYKANGFNKGPNIIVTDTKDTQRGLDTETIYVNLEQLSSFSAGDLVNAIAHESSHSEVLGESEETFAIEKGSRAKDKFDSPKDTEKVDLDGYLNTLECEYTKEKIRLAEVKEKLPEEKGEEFTQYVAPIALQAEQIFMDVATKYGTIIANKLQELYYVYGPVVLEAVSTGGQKLVEYLSSKGGDSATGGNFNPNDPKWKEIINKNNVKISENDASKILHELENKNKDAHFYSRYGAQVKLDDLYVRATKGLTPDGLQSKPVDASKFTSNNSQLEAIKKAEEIFKNTKKSVINFDFGSKVGEGYLKGGGKLVETTKVQAIFKNGKLITIFPKLK